MPPDGLANLILTRSPDGDVQGAIAGPTLVSYTVPVCAGWTYGGLRVRAGVAAGLLGAAPALASHAPWPTDRKLRPVWQALAATMAGDRADWQACAPLAAATARDELVAAAADRLIWSGGSDAIGALAATAGLGERQFRRRFRQGAGLSPKRFADLQRARRALILSLGERDWARIALDAGFADQPHLARDVRGRFGATPGDVRYYLDGIRHELRPLAGVRFVQDAGAAAR